MAHTSIVWSELFPSTKSILIFIGYMSLFISQGNLITEGLPSFRINFNSTFELIFKGILVTASQESDSGYNYNTVLAVLMTEVLKLIISICLFINEKAE